MKILKLMMVGVIGIASTFSVQAQSLGDLLNGLKGGTSNSSNSGSNSGLGGILSNVIEGVFTKTNLSVADLVGEYTAQGPAVTFKSENFLQKAGGLAGAAAIESKLNPYYEQYGLNNMQLSVDKDANFSMKVKGISLKGKITKNESEGTFDFNFSVLGMNIGKFTAYIEKSGNNLNLMFDATKLKSLISTITKVTGNSMASAVSSILDSYEGACIGWKMVATSTNQTNSSESGQNEEQKSSSSSLISTGLDKLKGVLNKGK